MKTEYNAPKEEKQNKNTKTTQNKRKQKKGTPPFFIRAHS
jgi:hypothetical protein